MVNKSAVENWAKRGRKKFASDPEGAMLDGMKVCHKHAGVTGKKSEALREIESTIFKAKVANSLASSGRFTPDFALAILHGHKRDADAIYAAIQKDISLAKHLNVKPAGKERYLAQLDQLFEYVARQKKQGITAMPSLPHPLVEALRIFNEGAIRLHLGEGDYARYTKERAAFLRYAQQIGGFSIN